MSKPATVPQWDSNLTHTTATVAGHKTDGFINAETESSAEKNYWMNLVYQWCNYLNTGDIEIDAWTLPSTDVALANAANNNLDVGIGSGPRLVVRLTGGGASATLTGVTGGADGRTIVLYNATGADFLLGDEDVGSTAANRVAANDTFSATSVRVPPNGTFALRYYGATSRWVVFWASFPIDAAPIEVMVIPAAHAQGDGTAVFHQGAASYWDPNTGGTPTYPVRCPVGTVLKSVKLYLNKTSTGADSMSMKLWSVDSTTGTTTQIGSTQSTTGGGLLTLKLTGLSSSYANATSFIVTGSGTASVGKDRIIDLEVSYTRRFMPAPVLYTP